MKAVSSVHNVAHISGLVMNQQDRAHKSLLLHMLIRQRAEGVIEICLNDFDKNEVKDNEEFEVKVSIYRRICD